MKALKDRYLDGELEDEETRPFEEIFALRERITKHIKKHPKRAFESDGIWNSAVEQALRWVLYEQHDEPVNL